MKPVIDKYYTGWELLKRLEITPFQLLELIKKHKLMPHDQTGEFACRPDSISLINKCNQITRKELALGNIIRDKIAEGITRSEYRSLEEKRRKLDKEYQSLYDEHPWDPYDWGKYFPELDEAGTEESFKIICDLFFHEVDVLKLEGKYEYKVIDKRGEGIDGFFKDMLDDVSCYSGKSEIIIEDEIKFIDDDVVEKNDESSNDDILDPDELQVLVSVGKDAEAIYHRIRDEVGVTDKSMNSRPMRRDAAVNFFNKHLKRNSLIQENHLVDLDLYTFRSAQTFRDYMRRVLNTVLKDVFPKKHISGTKLYSIYRSDTKNG